MPPKNGLKKNLSVEMTKKPGGSKSSRSPRSPRSPKSPSFPILPDIDNITNSVSDEKIIKFYLEQKKFLADHDIVISTITLDCKLHTLIDIDKFALNVSLRENEIVSVKYGNRKDPATNRTIVVIKAKKSRVSKIFITK